MKEDHLLAKGKDNNREREREARQELCRGAAVKRKWDKNNAWKHMVWRKIRGRKRKEQGTWRSSGLLLRAMPLEEVKDRHLPTLSDCHPTS